MTICSICNKAKIRPSRVGATVCTKCLGKNQNPVYCRMCNVKKLHKTRESLGICSACLHYSGDVVMCSTCRKERVSQRNIETGKCKDCIKAELLSVSATAQQSESSNEGPPSRLDNISQDEYEDDF